MVSILVSPVDGGRNFFLDLSYHDQKIIQCYNDTYMKPEEIKSAPKLFCESISVGFTPEFFVMSLSSGSQASIYSLTPQHVKRLQQYLTHQVSEYEKEHGAIKADWNPNIVSPIKRMNPPSELS